MGSYMRLFDFTMATAFRLRGAEIIPVLSDYRFSQQFFYGMDNPQDETQGKKYSEIEKKVWRSLLKILPLFWADYRDENDKKTADTLSRQANLGNYQSITYKGYPAGLRAAEVVANLNYIPKISDEKLLVQVKTHISNIVELINCYERIIDDIHPDVVFSNIPFYYKWDTAYHVSVARKIPFYSVKMGGRKNTWLFTCNTRKMFDVSPAWPSFKEKELSDDTKIILDNSIASRFRGEVDAYSPYEMPGQVTDEHVILRKFISNKKPTAIFPVNVLYDAVAYQPNKCFSDITDMIFQVVAFFNQHPEYQLIIKAHPAEKLFHTQMFASFKPQYLKKFIEANNLNLGPNIFFLEYNSKIPMADILSLIKVGIVYTSSTAYEMAWFGKPVISIAETHYSGKGFVYEPENRDRFFQLLDQLLVKEEENSVIQERIDLSKKYYWLYYYHGKVDFRLFEGSDVGLIPTKILFDSYKSLLPGENAALDYICNSILNKLPIYADNRWPPCTY